MNAKLVKRMRQHARRLMAGKPERGLIAVGDLQQKVRHIGTHHDGSPKLEPYMVTPTLKNDPQTVRGMYRAMRKGFATRSTQS